MLSKMELKLELIENPNVLFSDYAFLIDLNDDFREKNNAPDRQWLSEFPEHPPYSLYRVLSDYYMPVDVKCVSRENDNTPCYRWRVLLHELKLALLAHSSYSPDLVPSDADFCVDQNYISRQHDNASDHQWVTRLFEFLTLPPYWPDLGPSE